MRSLGLELHKDVLDELPANAKVILAATCVQRHSEVYRAFARCSNLRRSADFGRILDSIWRDASSEQLSREQLAQMQERALKLVPGQARTGVYDANAEMAALSLAYCVGTRISGKTSDLLYAARQAFVSIWTFLVNPIGRTPQIDMTSPGAVAQFESHQLVQAEHARQERDLSDVRRMLDERRAAEKIVNYLEERSKAEERSLLPIDALPHDTPSE